MKNTAGRGVYLYLVSLKALTLVAVMLAGVISANGGQGNGKIGSGQIYSAADGMTNNPANNSGNPTIAYIGETAILTFDTNKDLIIPIIGSDLDQRDYSWNVTVSGV